MSKQAKINNLKAKLKEYNLKLDQYEHMFMADGVIDEVEKAQLNKMKGVIRKAEAKLDEMLNAPTKKRAAEANKSSKEKQKEEVQGKEEQNTSTEESSSSETTNNESSEDNASAEEQEEQEQESISTKEDNTVNSEDIEEVQGDEEDTVNDEEKQEGGELPKEFQQAVDALKAERAKIDTKLKKVVGIEDTKKIDFRDSFDKIEKLMGSARRAYGSVKEDDVFDRCEKIMVKEEQANNQIKQKIKEVIAKIESEEKEETQLDAKMKQLLGPSGDIEVFRKKLEKRVKEIKQKFGNFIKKAS